MQRLPKRLVLRYHPVLSPGQFSFSSFNNGASDEQLYNLAMRLNEFQTDTVHKVLVVDAFQF